jgi:hypothetical protein
MSCVCDCAWKPDSICVPAGNGKKEIDIVGYLKDHTHVHAELMGSRRRLEFPSDEYPPNEESKDRIVRAIITAAAEVDIHLVVRATVKKKDASLASINMACDQSRAYRPPKSASTIQKNVYKEMGDSEQSIIKGGIKNDNFINRRKAGRVDGKKSAKRTYTTKPPPGQTCSFQLRLCLDPGKCWYLPPWAGNVWHNHEKLGAGEKRRRMVTLSQQHQYEAGVFSRHGTSGQTSGILNELHGNTFSSSQINHNKKKQDVAEGFVPPPSGDIESNPKLSDAENVVRFLNKEQMASNKEYVALYYEVTETTLHTVRAADKRREHERLLQEKRNTNTALKEQDELEDGNQNGFEVELECSGPTGIAKRSKARLTSKEKTELGCMLLPVLERLRVGQKLLLAVAWVRADEKRLFELYPEVLMIDVTYGTNSEGRPLGLTACFDPDMKSFTPIRVFMPSECCWVFRWIWDTAIPNLLGRQNLKRVQLVLTDGDSKIYEQFNQVKEAIYSNACHGLCIYHLIVQPLQKGITDKGDPIVKAMFHTYVFLLFFIGSSAVLLIDV